VQSLPIGISFIGKKWADADVLSAGYAFEQGSKAKVKPGYLTGFERE
jgi:amidase